MKTGSNPSNHKFLPGNAYVPPKSSQAIDIRQVFARLAAARVHPSSGPPMVCSYRLMACIFTCIPAS
jgi:hypothetical protein